MKKHVFSLVFSIFGLMMFSQTYDVTISGMVTDENTGNPVFGQEITISVDSLSGGFMYFNTVTTGDGGYYEDIVQVPMGEQGMVDVHTMSCGAMLMQSGFFSMNTAQLTFDFEVCTNPVGSDCEAFFEYFQGNEPLSIQFIDLSTGWPQNWNWYWDFGDGTSSMEQNPLHFYPHEGEYPVSLTIEGDSCHSEYGVLVRVENDTTGNCQASFYYLQGTAPFSIEFFDTSTGEGDVNSWTWDFGDGGVSYEQNPVHTYDYEGYYYVSLYIETTDSCFSGFADYVWVENDTTNCNAAFDVMLDTLNNVPRTYIFTDRSEGGIESWLWEFGDGSFSYEQSPVHVYDAGGSYDVCLTVTTAPGNGMCTSTECKQISTLQYYNFGGQAFIGNYPINIDSSDDANIAIAYLYRKINNSWQYMDQREFWEYGYYWFAEKPVGEYLIKTELKENSQEYFQYAPAYYVDATSWKDAKRFTLSNNQQFAVNVSFKELAQASSGIGRLSGTVVGGQSCDTIQNIDVDHVLVQLFNNAKELVAYTFTDEDAVFEFTGLGMGSYLLKAEYTGRHSDEMNIALSNAEPNIDDIGLTVHCAHTLGINEMFADNSIQVKLPYPNPANNYFNVEVISTRNTSGTLTIYNINGNVVHNRALNIDMGSQIVSTQVNTLPPGLYSMKITLNDHRFQKNHKIIIIH